MTDGSVGRRACNASIRTRVQIPRTDINSRLHTVHHPLIISFYSECKGRHKGWEECRAQRAQRAFTEVKKHQNADIQAELLWRLDNILTHQVRSRWKVVKSG